MAMKAQVREYSIFMEAVRRVEQRQAETRDRPPPRPKYNTKRRWYHPTEGKCDRSAAQRAMFIARMNSETLQAIGDEWGLSRERVRQVVEREERRLRWSVKNNHPYAHDLANQAFIWKMFDELTPSHNPIWDMSVDTSQQAIDRFNRFNEKY